MSILDAAQSSKCAASSDIFYRKKDIIKGRTSVKKIITRNLAITIDFVCAVFFTQLNQKLKTTAIVTTIYLIRFSRYLLSVSISPNSEVCFQLKKKTQ